MTEWTHATWNLFHCIPEKIKKDLSKYGGNNFVLMPVGEKQLIMGCSESDKDKNKQLENRYSYVFVIK